MRVEAEAEAAGSNIQLIRQHVRDAPGVEERRVPHNTEIGIVIRFYGPTKIASEFNYCSLLFRVSVLIVVCMIVCMFHHLSIY